MLSSGIFIFVSQFELLPFFFISQGLRDEKNVTLCLLVSPNLVFLGDKERLVKVDSLSNDFSNS